MVGQAGEPLEILSREPFPNSSTFPVEIITCRQKDGTVLTLFGKYLGGKGPNNFGHRGGVAYEASVYTELLSRTDLPTTHCYGKCTFADTGETLLVLQYLGENLLFSRSEDPQSLSKASSWIGSFHAMHEGAAPAFLTVYTRDYYTGWAKRFTHLAGRYRSEYRWLDGLVEFFLARVDLLCNTPQTIIHGEYYPKNVLLKDGLIYPVDWESAAIAPGEIDFASVTEGWDEEPTEAAKQAYMQARWPSQNSSLRGFEARLLMAKIYWFLWWWPVKMRPESWTEDSYRFNQALQLAKDAAVL